jgi:CDP-glucose 4,6-dehydratase
MENLEIRKQFDGAYVGKKVVVTGNTGFKGSWLTAWLLELGAKVYGISNGIPTAPLSLFEEAELEQKIEYKCTDVRDAEGIKKIFETIQPDFVFHLAAQPIVIQSYHDPVDTMSTNIMGTVNVLEALRKLENNCTAVMITSDKCYDNVEWLWGYRETDALGGKDPYSASKGAAELMIKSYYHSFFSKNVSKVRVAAVRAGNVIGGGDWAANRIVPDCIKAWFTKMPVEIRSPQATRPWQHVLEPLSGYLLAGKLLAEQSELNGEAFNFGPNSDQNKTVLELIEALASYWGGDTNHLYNVIPNPNFKEAGLLKLNCDKALHLLQWKPVLNFNETAELTALWYKQANQQTAGLYHYTVNQIKKYSELAAGRQLIWCNY